MTAILLLLGAIAGAVAAVAVIYFLMWREAYPTAKVTS